MLGYDTTGDGRLDAFDTNQDGVLDSFQTRARVPSTRHGRHAQDQWSTTAGSTVDRARPVGHGRAATHPRTWSAPPPATAAWGIAGRLRHAHDPGSAPVLLFGLTTVPRGWASVHSAARLRRPAARSAPEVEQPEVEKIAVRVPRAHHLEVCEELVDRSAGQASGAAGRPAGGGVAPPKPERPAAALRPADGAVELSWAHAPPPACAGEVPGTAAG